MDAVEINTSGSPQNEDGIVHTVSICRVCLLGNTVMRDLFLETEVASLSAKAMSFANVKIMPDDGLPSQICCMCAEKLESAYEFKLQVEQADSVLREKFDSINIKEELFFNDVEVHLHNVNRTNNTSEMVVGENYVETEATLEDIERNAERGILKDHLALLEVQKLDEQSQHNLETGHERMHVPVAKDYNKNIDNQDTNVIQETFMQIEELPENVEHLDSTDNICEMNKAENNSETTQGNQQDDTLSGSCVVSCAETDFQLQVPMEAIENSEVIPTSEDNQMHDESQVQSEENQDLSQNETRRSKRKLSRKSATTERDSDEENYFENLNLSSRLRKAQSDKADKVFFACYLCEKQFVSKDVLKEHMHSHEEIRQVLSLKKTPEKAQRTTPTKMPPSGKRANKCPYCGKEYLYIISFNKHLKQHERESTDTRDQSMPLEISFHEDDDSLNFSGLDARDDSDNVDEDVEDAKKKETAEEEQIFSCDKCSENFTSKRALQKHGIKHVVLNCNVCGENFNTLEKLREHRSKHVMEGVMTEQDLKEEKENLEVMESEKKENEREEGGEENIDSEGDVEDKPKENSLKCPHCLVTYCRKKSFLKHMETHEETKHICKICNQRFPKKEHLRRHMEQHGKAKTFKCTQCNKIFGNELTLRNHLIATNHKTIILGQEYDPNKRIKRVAAKAAQKIIDRIKTENDSDDYDEDILENNDGNDEDLYLPIKEEQKTKKMASRKSLDCTTCNKRCVSRLSLTKHMESHVKDEKQVKNDRMEKQITEMRKEQEKSIKPITGVDDDNGDDTDDFESGLDWPMDTFECPTCKKRYSTKKSLLRHQLLHEEPNFECDICNVKFYRKDKLKAHYDKCSEMNPDQVRKCNICGDSFENNEMLREHRSIHVTEGILTEEDLRDTEPRQEERKSGEKVQRKRRTDIVGLECTECNKRYTSRKGLLRHIQVHEGKKYLCDICPKKFYRREHLKIHVAKHNMVKPYKCTRCTKRFIKEEQLTNHLSKHDRTFKKNKETDSSKRFLCEICSKSFTQSTTLIAHLRAHNGIKPYVCEVCSRPFTTNAYLKMHMRTHTQERPYICHYCSRAFARADTLANHLTSHTGEAKYHCKYCPKNFRRLKSLKEHVFIHTGQRPYACPTCDRRFNNNGSRYAHSKRCKQNMLQNQNRTQNLVQVQNNQIQQTRIQQPLNQTQVIKSQNIKTITIARPAEQLTTQPVMQHQEILMPLILPLTVTLADVGEEVILPEGTKIFTTS